MRLVLDTNVVVSALLWQGTPNDLLHQCEQRNALLCTSIPLLAELIDVLSRDKLKRRLAIAGGSPNSLVELY